MNWYYEHPKKVHFDMHSPDTVEGIGAGFDPEAYASKKAAANCDAVVVFAKCAYGWTYAHNDFIENHPNLVHKDLFGSIRQALEKKGVETVAYFSSTTLSKAVMKRHPEWSSINSEGQYAKHSDDDVIRMVCVNSDYWREAFIPMVQQIVRDNHLSSIWMDGFYQLLNHKCHCDKCRTGFGKEIPTDETPLNYRPYHRYVHKQIDLLLKDIKTAVSEVNPDCCVGGDWIGSNAWGERLPSAIDFLSCDVFMGNASFNTAYAVSGWSYRGLPFDIYSERMYWWQDFNSRPLAALLLDQAITVASGGLFMIGDVIEPKKLEVSDQQAKTYETVFSKLTPLLEATRHGKTIADIALLNGVEDTRDYGATWTLEKNKHMGMYSQLVEAGYSVHTMGESDLMDGLDQYRLLVIPELAYVSSKAAVAIQQYVEAGGALFLVGALPAIVNPDFEIKDNMGLSRVGFEKMAGLKYCEDKSINAFFNVSDTPLEGLWGDYVPMTTETVSGKHVLATINGGNTICPLINEGQAYQIGAVVPGQPSKYVGISEHAYGKGKVVFSAYPLGSNGWTKGHASSYLLTETVVKYLDIQPEFKLVGPSETQLIVLKKEDGHYVVTVIAHQQPAQVSYMRNKLRPNVISDCSLLISKDMKIKSIESLEDENVHCTEVDDHFKVEIPKFSLFKTLEIKVD